VPPEDAACYVSTKKSFWDVSPWQYVPEEKMPEEDESRQDRSGNRNSWVQIAKYSQLAFVFPAATVAGWLIGAALDRWLHTTWLYLAGVILGIVAGFVELIRAALSTDSK
jgi:F0F1-type ATP synthase assembly protein I